MNETKQNFLTVKTPAKLILSGEHAVVHGYPALSIAINRYMNVTLRWTSPMRFSFHLLGINFRRQITLPMLRKLKSKLKYQYQQYCLGDLNIREVLQKPFELSLFTFINVIDHVKRKLPIGIDIVTDSNIPIGCGMGSSAASIVSLMYALIQLLNLDLNLEDYMKLGVESENLQHGHSSGLDVHTVYHGGCLHYEKGKFATHRIDNPPLQLVHTGQPQSSTGECVNHTTTYFKNSQIGKDFAAVTDNFTRALQQHNVQELKRCIRHNHQLLRTIGVVPDKVNDFIVDVEKLNGAAKICGAGSIRGEQSGAVLVVANDSIAELATQYGYQVMPIQIDNQGTRVI